MRIIITKSDVKKGAKFIRKNTVFVVDEIENYDNETLVHSSIAGGEKGNYIDTINDFIDFINE